MVSVTINPELPLQIFKQAALAALQHDRVDRDPRRHALHAHRQGAQQARPEPDEGRGRGAQAAAEDVEKQRVSEKRKILSWRQNKSCVT